MESSNYNSTDASGWTGNGSYLSPRLDLHGGGGTAPLRMRVLRTARERKAIASLRRHAAFNVEQDLGLDLGPLEQIRDDMGLVTAVSRNKRLLATLRFVPTGHRLTGAERLMEKVPFDTSILGKGSWEVGRVIMAPEDRHPDLLVQCLKVTLEELMQLEDVRHFHATTTLAMARLWRRIGMRTVVTATGASGARYALVHGSVEGIGSALQEWQAKAARRQPSAPAELAIRPASGRQSVTA